MMTKKLHRKSRSSSINVNVIGNVNGFQAQQKVYQLPQSGRNKREELTVGFTNCQYHRNEKK